MTITRQSGEESVVYPESDGKPMADNTLQFSYISMLKNGFDGLYLDSEDVFVAGDLLWYPVEGNNKTRYAPDVLIAFGRPKGFRGSYLQWEEGGQPPQVVFEVLSPSNTRPEMTKKFKAYDCYGVEEYYEYDPDRGQLKAWLRGPSTGKLEPFTSQDNSWRSPRTGVTMQLQDKALVVTRPDGRNFYDSEQAEIEFQRAERESQRAEQEFERAEKLAQKLREAGIDPDV